MLLRDGAKKFVGGGEWRAVEAFGAGKIEIGFVDGNHLHDGRKFREDGGDAVAPFGIFFVMAIEENRVRAETPGGAKRHGGVNAEFASFVAGGGDYAALIGPAADDDGLAAEFRALEQFDGNKKGVHVHVEDGGVEGKSPAVRRDRAWRGSEPGPAWDKPTTSERWRQCSGRRKARVADGS